jgi:hypothetical protein
MATARIQRRLGAFLAMARMIASLEPMIYTRPNDPYSLAAYILHIALWVHDLI